MGARYVRVEVGPATDDILSKSGDWIVASVRQQVGWPTALTLVEYAGRELLLLPQEKDSLPAVAARREGNETEADLRGLMTRFLSAVAWEKNHGIEVVGWTGGSRPHRYGQRAVANVSSPFRLVHLPDELDSKQRLALAFFREASSLTHPGYSFLSYYKILNLRYRNTDKQRAWIRRALPRVTDTEGRARLQALNEQNIDVAEYLYVSCRCAIAHAGVSPTVDPDNVADQQRLRLDLPLIRALARDCIESEFGVPTLSSVLREHEHELAGFLEVLGATRQDAILSGLQPVDLDTFLPRLIHVGLWRAADFPPLRAMTLHEVTLAEALVSLRYVSQRGTVTLDCALDLESRRLLFDPECGIEAVDDGSADALFDAAAAQDFLGQYCANGSIEFWDAQSGACLGWCTPFIPTNVDLRRTIESYRAAASELRTEALARRLRGHR